MYGGFDGWRGGSCDPFVLAPTSYKASYFGYARDVHGLWLSRMPEFADKDWFAEDGRWKVRHDTASALLENIVKDGVTWEPQSVAGSQWGDGSWMKSPNDCVVWYQVNYAPRGSVDYANPIAGLAVVEVMEATKTQQQSDPDNQKFELISAWLIEDDNGDPYHWDAESKLCNHHSTDGTQVTCVGVEHFALWERRTPSSSQHRVTYWGIDQVQPTIHTWTNPEEDETATNWPCVNLSRHAFPMGQGKRTYIEYHEDETLKRVRHKYRNGVINLGASMLLKTSDVETNDPGVGPRIHCQRTSGAPEFSLSDCRVYFRSWDLTGQWRPTVGEEEEEPDYPFYVPATYDENGSEPADEGVQYQWRDAYVISAPWDDGANVLGAELGYNLSDTDDGSTNKRLLWGSQSSNNEGLGVLGVVVTSGKFGVDELTTRYLVSVWVSPHNHRGLTVVSLSDGTGGTVATETSLGAYSGSSMHTIRGSLAPAQWYVGLVADNGLAAEDVFDPLELHKHWYGPESSLETDTDFTLSDDFDADTDWNDDAWPSDPPSEDTHDSFVAYSAAEGEDAVPSQHAKQGAATSIKSYPPLTIITDGVESQIPNRLRGTWYSESGSRYDTGRLGVTLHLDGLCPTFDEAVAKTI